MEKISYLKTHTRKGVYVCIYIHTYTHTRVRHPVVMKMHKMGGKQPSFTAELLF